MTTRRAGVVAAAAVLACGVALAGCSADEEAPTESRSSSSASSSASSSTDSASSSSSTSPNPDGAGAIAIVQNFERTDDQMRIDSSIPTDDLESFATGQAYTQRTSDIREIRQQGQRYRGYVTVRDAKATKRSETSQQVTACIDMSGLRVTDKNGTKVGLPRDREGRIYRVERGDGTGMDGRWRVTAVRVKETC